jgi:hypothetical protein
VSIQTETPGPPAPPAPRLGEPGEVCESCGAALAVDQRYCLNCGRARADSRVPYAEALQAARGGGEGTAPPSPSGSPAPDPAGWNPMLALVGVGVVAVVLGVGVLIGRGVSGTTKRAAAPQVISVGGAGGATASTAKAAAAGFKSDWPAGKDGWTVELQVLPKDGTQASAVAAAKSAAQGKGAPNVGALDSDRYPSLDGGQYVVYSGVFKDKSSATKALNGLKKNFPKAKVVHVSRNAAGGASATGPAKTVSRQQLQELNNTSGSDYFKRSSRLPKKIAIPGPPPAKDNKPAGGGSGGGETIG